MIAPKGKLLIKVDTKQKEKLAWVNDSMLEIKRGYNFNLREDRSSSSILLDGEGLPKGCELLVHHLSTEPCYEVLDHDLLTEKEIEEGYKIFSVPSDNGFMYRENKGEWKPCKPFVITLRMYKPYTGKLAGVKPERIEGALYCVTGTDEYEGEKMVMDGKVVLVTKNSDYEIIFHNDEHREERMMKTWLREIMAVDENLTKQVKSGKILVGLDINNAKTLK